MTSQSCDLTCKFGKLCFGTACMVIGYSHCCFVLGAASSFKLKVCKWKQAVIVPVQCMEKNISYSQLVYRRWLVCSEFDQMFG